MISRGLVSPPVFRVVVVNFNAGPLLAQAVEGLAGQTYGNFEAVIVDNGSSDRSLESLVLPDARFTLIRSTENLGFAAACNLGARGAKTQWLGMLNPDAVPFPDWLEKIVAAQSEYPEATMFGSTQISAQDHGILDGAGDNYSIFGLAWRGGFGQPIGLVRGDMRVLSPCAAAAFYRRDVFEAAEGFAELFFCYLEDVDLGLRLNLKGEYCVQVAQARVYHHGSAITGRRSRFTIFHSVRNGLWLMVRCVPLPVLVPMLPLYCVCQIWLGLRDDSLSFRIEGMAAARKSLRRPWAERSKVRRGVAVGLWGFFRLIVWNPFRLSRRDIVALPEVEKP